MKAVQDLVKKDCRITIDEIATTLEISYGSAFLILTDHLGLSKLSSRWASKALEKDQLVQRAELSMSFLSKIEVIDNDFMEQIVTVDETWIYQYNLECKIESMQWVPKGSTGPIKFKFERSVKKVMATVFWDSQGIILVDFLEGSKTITGIYYKGVLKVQSCCD